jgi:hypothetical protein
MFLERLSQFSNLSTRALCVCLIDPYFGKDYLYKC